jgi:hypothetical protein
VIFIVFIENNIYCNEKRKTNFMWILQSTIVIIAALLSQLPIIYGQNQCSQAAIANCGSYPCVQTGNAVSCLCPDMSLQPSAAQCNGGIIGTTTQPTTIIPNQCANAICPAGATCIPTNQNPAQYVCICPNNVIANPDCPINPLPINPCLTNNPCRNGATCVVNPLNYQAVCVCPTGSYGANCAYGCRQSCDANW